MHKYNFEVATEKEKADAPNNKKSIPLIQQIGHILSSILFN